MNILLIQPPIQDFYRTQFREYPLGLLYIASTLIKLGHSVTLIDARKSRKPKTIPTPNELKYLRNYYNKQNNLFLNYKHFGISFEEIANKAKELRPDIILINSMFTTYTNEIIKTAQHLKTELPNCKILVGGHQATSDPQSLASINEIDLIIRGEGENINYAIENIKTLSKIYPSKPDKPLIAKELDSLFFPARELIRSQDYKLGKKTYTMIITSRGCPHKCSFCSINSMYDNTYRTRSIESILQEIDESINKHKIEAIDFQDDNLLYEKERIKILLEKIVQKYSPNNVEFLASNGLNAEHLDNEFVTLLKKTGFKKLDIALGTKDLGLRNKMKRPESLQKYENIVKLANTHGLGITTYIILGFPNQSLKEMHETFEYLKDKPTLISPSIFYNVPSMPIFKHAKDFEYSQNILCKRSSAFNCFGNDFTRNDIFKLFKQIREYNLNGR